MGERRELVRELKLRRPIRIDPHAAEIMGKWTQKPETIRKVGIVSVKFTADKITQEMKSGKRGRPKKGSFLLYHNYQDLGCIIAINHGVNWLNGICRLTGLGMSTVQKSLKWLQEKGIIEKLEKNKIYRLTEKGECFIDFAKDDEFFKACVEVLKTSPYWNKRKN